MDPMEAAHVAQQQWAGFVERLAELPDSMPTNAGSDVEPAQDATDDQILLLQFNRNPSDMMTAMNEGLPLRKCREALLAEGHDWRLPSGTMVFVHPWQYRLCLHALIGKEMQPSTVIVSQSLEYLLEECLTSIQKRVWAKCRDVLPLCQKNEEDASVDGEDADVQASSSVDRELFHGLPAWSEMGEFQAKRTFLCVAPLLPSMAVTQSTTDAHSCNLNPRHVCQIHAVDL